VTERKRLFTILAAIPLLIAGSRITLAGVNPRALLESTAGSRGGLLGLYELVFQGGLHRGAILGLGIMPYLSARIFMRLWRAVYPEARPSKNGTRILTGVLSGIQSFGLAIALQRMPGVVADPGPGFVATTVLTLTAASLVAMWFGERLTSAEDDDLETVDDPATGPLASPSAAPALIAPSTPASQPIHPHPSTDAEILRTRR
jgi:preprotein translocase subunit SecY